MSTPRTGAGVRRRAPDTLLVTGVKPEALTPARVALRFGTLLEEGARLRPVGTARSRPARLLTPRYLPRHELRLFDTRFFLGDYRFDDSVGFFVGYVLQAGSSTIWPRVFYKDSSLLWRVASHIERDEGEIWIGKGDTRIERRSDGEYLSSAEETVDLPYEVQFAFDILSRRATKRRDNVAMELVAREAPSGRLAPYEDFLAPRRRAAALYRENGGRPVARFLRSGDPASLRFVRGYEPDFRHGVVEKAISASAYFGGRIRKFRVLSGNRRVQYLFFASPTHAWAGPPQLLTTELSSFGVRTLDVNAPADAFMPAYEYHDEEESQIPAGFAGAAHPKSPGRADASAWLELLPVIRAFRREVLARPRRKA